MTQEDKDLLLKDLCTRLPYGVKCKVKYIINNETTYGEDVERECIDTIKRINFDTYSVYTEWLGYESDIEDIKPYLRPLSSMTDDEFTKLKEYSGLIYDQLDLASFQNDTYKCLDFYLNEVPSYVVILVFDWLNKNHFDYRGLIERDLAIAVTEDNNPYK